MGIGKGQPGYIKARKMKYLAAAIVEFAIVIALVVLGVMQTGSRLNLLTVIAAVGCLPAAKMLVEFIAMAPHRSVEPAVYQELQEKAPALTKAFDLVITGNNKIMPVEAFVISGHTVCGYTTSPKTDEVKLARYLKELFASGHCEKVTVKIFHDYSAFLSRAEGMNSIAVVEHADPGGREKKLLQMLLTVSM